jgi:hypothetical protein
MLAMIAVAAPLNVSVAQTPGSQTGVSQSVASFKDNPGQLLTQFPNGGPELVSRVRELAVSDPTLLDPIIALLANATKDQKTGIASGLAQAARVVVRTNQPYATRIQQAIADTKDQDVVLAYAAASGDVAIAATGAGGAGSAGASGGQTTGLGGPAGGGGTLEAINGSSTATGLFSFTSSTSGTGSSTTGSSTTTTTTLIGTTSP